MSASSEIVKEREDIKKEIKFLFLFVFSRKGVIKIHRFVCDNYKNYSNVNTTTLREDLIELLEDEELFVDNVNKLLYAYEHLVNSEAQKIFNKYGREYVREQLLELRPRFDRLPRETTEEIDYATMWDEEETKMNEETGLFAGDDLAESLKVSEDLINLDLSDVSDDESDNPGYNPDMLMDLPWDGSLPEDLKSGCEACRLGKCNSHSALNLRL